MKKILLQTTFLTITLASSIFSQWSTDPNDNLIIGYGLNPELCSDSAGGCYVTYEYGTTGYPRKLALERLNIYGYKPWGDKKQILGELPEQWQAEIVEDGEGGVIISYLDDIISGTDFTYRVRVQRIDSAGNFLWSNTGVRVTTAETNHGNQAIVSDGIGGCIVVWSQILPDYTYDYRANRINNLGERAWSDTGIILVNSGSSEPANIVRASDGNYYIQISNIYRLNQYGHIINQYYGNMLGQPIPDSEGGVILSGGANWSINGYTLVAQRKDSLGNNLWQEPYVEIADSLGLGSFRIGVNKSIISYTWLGALNGQSARPFMQSVRLDGSIIYPNKILLSNDSSGTTIIGIIPSNLQKTIYSWSIASEVNSIFAQMYDTLGNKLWNENGVKVTHPRMTYQKYTTDSRGGFIIAGLIDNFTVLVQQVSRNGNLGEIITAVDEKIEPILPSSNALHQNYPNPFNSSTIIKYQAQKEGRIKIKLYNVLGEKIKTLFEGERSAGTYKINFSSDELPSGNYFYSLEGNSFREVKKLTILK